MRGSSTGRQRGIVFLVAVFGLVAGVALTAGACGRPQPVSTITYQLSPEDGQTITSADLDITVGILRDRVAKAGLAGVQVRAVSPDRVQVGLPKGADRQAVEAVTSPAGVLQFVLLPPEDYGTAESPGIRPVPAEGDAIDPTLPAQFTGADLDRSKVRPAWDDMASGWVISFVLTESATDSFGTWTGQHVGEYFAIVVDGKVLTAPYIKSAIEGGEGLISGGFTEESAKSLAAVLRSGALPAPMIEVSFESGW